LHNEARHTWLAAHFTPQEPQLFGSDVRSTQTLLQLTCPFGQHNPLEHTVPQGRPQPPQFCASVAVFTHAVPHGTPELH